MAAVTLDEIRSCRHPISIPKLKSGPLNTHRQLNEAAGAAALGGAVYAAALD
jgi:hypothetical protein